MTRREISLKICRQVDADLPKETPEEARREAYSEAYPFGERKYFPYKAWCAAVREHLAARAKLAAWSGL